jgi:hypothetical protein
MFIIIRSSSYEVSALPPVDASTAATTLSAARRYLIHVRLCCSHLRKVTGFDEPAMDRQ